MFLDELKDGNHSAIKYITGRSLHQAIGNFSDAIGLFLGQRNVPPAQGSNISPMYRCRKYLLLPLPNGFKQFLLKAGAEFRLSPISPINDGI